MVRRTKKNGHEGGPCATGCSPKLAGCELLRATVAQHSIELPELPRLFIPVFNELGILFELGTKVAEAIA